MALSAFNQALVQKLETLCDSSSISDLERGVSEAGLSAVYATEIGRVVLSALIADKKNIDIHSWHGICRRKEDPRCQVGQIKSNLESRLFGTAARGASENTDLLRSSYNSFMKNVSATAMLLDKKGLTLKEIPNSSKVELSAVKSLDSLDLAAFGAEGKSLCDDYFYAEERVPNGDILGSGFFIANDKLLTAAHVLERALFYGTNIDDFIVIRGHFAYNSRTKSIKVYKDQIYRLDQNLIINDQIRYGRHAGDIAWIKVAALFEDGHSLRTLEQNPRKSSSLEKGQIVYTLGHGLGVPMKLAHGGIVTDPVYDGRPAMFECDIHVLPGSSGSPVFDSDHGLIGIVSGAHKIEVVHVPDKDCVTLQLDLEGNLSSVITYVEPFSHLIQKNS
jgi:V8-like Glu-specific endopeptidase